MVLKRNKRQPTSSLTCFIFHQAPVLLLLTCCCEGQIQVIGPSQAVTVMVDDDIILPCHLKPASDASGMTFEWARPDLKPRFVHVWHEGQDLHVNQHSSFKGRTSVDITKLKYGDISLKLSKVKHTDRGIYRCYFPDLDKETTVQLFVGSVSQAVVRLTGIDQSISGVVLQCESAGWYPEPELLWLDGEGNLLSAGPAETLRGPDDLYSVSSRVTVEKRHSNNITCRVQQRNTNQSRETHIHVPDDFFGTPCSSAACIAISTTACVMSVLVLIFALWKNKHKTTMTRQQENLDHTENQKMKDDMTKLTKELQKKEEEHKNMVGTLMLHKKELKEEKDKFKLQLMKMEEVVEASEMDLHSKEQEKGSSSAPSLDLKKKVLECKWSVNETVTASEKLLLSIEKLLQYIETVASPGLQSTDSGHSICEDSTLISEEEKKEYSDQINSVIIFSQE
ncbi:butyrophilin subfamily 3 member A2-like [Simochromis diagramma]|uniref:butyrophilin subfamily 3 member A2-like n=1 Tax=Simochromis diagramma TaxID=43689 RepID=UPI001A7F0379|nr:butyrophilin subfamily 3 member A2-like [Simochromis diagramma]